MLLEVLMEIIVEGVIEGGKSKAIPKTVRNILFVFACVLFSSVIGVFLYLGLMSRYSFWLNIVFLGLAVAITRFFAKFTREDILKLREGNLNDPD